MIIQLLTLFIPKPPCPRSVCTLETWLIGAKRFQETFTTSKVVYNVLTTRKRSSCLDLDIPHSILVDRRIEEMVSKSQTFREMNLIKWNLWSFNNYDILIYTDLDVDIMPLYPIPISRSADASFHDIWHLSKKHNFNVIVNPDHSSPINGGMFLIFNHTMNKHIYHRGLDVLRKPFNYTHGWELRGSPKTLLGERILYHPDGSVFLYAGKPATIDNADWKFVNGDSDQGLFTYMLLHKFHRFVRYSTGKGFFVRHYWGSNKPMERIFNAVDPSCDLNKDLRTWGRHFRGNYEKCTAVDTFTSKFANCEQGSSSSLNGVLPAHWGFHMW